MRRLFAATAVGWFVLAGASKASAAGTVSFPEAGFDRTIQGDAAQSLHVRVCNVAGGDTGAIDRVRFRFGGAFDEYDFSPTQSTVFPAGWTAEFTGNNEIRFIANAAADRIALGACKDFDVRLEPNGNNLGDTFSRAAGDVTDRFSDVRTRHQPSNAEGPSIAASLPWIRHGLALTLVASPASVAPGATVGLQYLVENRTTAAQTVSSSPAVPAAEQGTFSGPASTTPSSAVVAAGDGATLTYAATSVGGPNLQFRAGAASGSATSPSTLSNLVLVGMMTASLEVLPASIISGESFDVVMRVRNNGTTALGGVQPTRDPVTRSSIPDPLSIGTAAIAKVSGPSPSQVPSLSPGTTAVFRWTYTATGTVGQTFQVSGGALANGVPNPPFPGNQTALAVSNAGRLASLGIRVTPPIIARGDTSPVTFSLSNGTSLSDNNHVRLDFPAGFVVATSTSPSGYSCAINGAGDSVTCNPIGANTWDAGEVLDITVTFTPTGIPIPPGDADEPHQIFVHHHLVGPGTDTSATLLVSAYLLNLVAVPTTAPADGLSVVDLSATLTRVSTGLPVPGATIAFESSAGRLASNSVVTDATGTGVVRLIAPASPATVLASVSATHFNHVDLETVTFSGFNGPLLLYVGGTLFQREVAPGTSVSFQIDVANLGTSAVTVTAGTFSFTSTGVGCTFSAPLPPATVAAGMNATLTFGPSSVPAGCVTGVQTFPTFSYNPSQTIEDPVSITGTPTFASVSGLAVERVGTGAQLRWETDLELNNAGFRILRAIDAGEPEAIGWVDAIGEAFSGYGWTDVGPLPAGLNAWWIEDVSLDGIGTLHGPVFLDADAPTTSTDTIATTQTVPGAGESVWSDPDDLGDVRVLEADDDGITYEITPPPFLVERVPWPVALRDRLRIEGYGSTEDPGFPMLPVRSFRVPLPPWTEGSLRVREEEVEAVSGLDPAPYLGASGPPDVPMLSPATQVFPPRRRNVEPRTYPVSSVALSRNGKMGNTAVRSLVITPLRWDASTATMHRTARIVVRVDFRPVAPAPGMSLSAAEARHRRILAEDSLKVMVTGAGLVRVPLAAVGDAGVSMAAPAVFRRGEPIPSRVVGTDLVFAAPEEVDSWTDGRAYWVSSAEPGRTLPLVETGAPPAPDASEALHLRRFEVNRIHGLLAAQGSGPDRWYWTEVMSGGAAADVSADLSQAPAGTATLSVVLQGMFDAPEIEDEHAVRVRLAGQDLGTVQVSGFERRSFDLAVPSGLLAAGPNTIRLESVSTGPSRVALDAIALSFRAPADARGAAELLVTTAHDGVLTAGGFAGPVTHALDVTDPGSPRLLAASGEDGGAGTFRAAVAASAGRRVLFVTSHAGPSLTLEARPARAIGDSPGVEYVVVAADGLGGAAQGFADWRASPEGGYLRSASFEIGDVHDAWSFGDVDPIAVRRLLQHAQAELPGAPPRYLLLVGDSTFDPANRLGAGIPEGLLLSAKIDTEFLWAASDAALGTLDGDGLPDVAVGRIPARTPVEVTRALERTRAYEQAPRDGWDRREVLLADDDLPEFGRSADEAALRRQADTEALLLSAATDGDSFARTALLGSLSHGVALTTFVGHGGVQTWGGEPFLATADAAGLAPPSRSPVVLAVNCLNGFFDHPLADGLAEKIIRADGGAVAMYSSSAITRNEGHREIALAFHRAFWRDPSARRLGDVAQRAVAATAWRDDGRALAESFVLLGDPALRINVNAPPTAVVRLASLDERGARLSGGASFDPDGDPLEWRWELVSEPAGAMARLESDGADTHLHAPVHGRYRVRLRVSDGRVASPADEQIVVIGSAVASERVVGCRTTGPSAGSGGVMLALVLCGLSGLRRRGLRR